MMNLDFFRLPSEINMDIARRMKRRRKEQDITQIRLAELSQVGLGSIKRFEQTGEISLSSLVKIAFALGCQDDFDSLFACNEYMSIKEAIYEGNRHNL